jgi:regulator of PEP synthase PpsR (kinase-PPPase family)
MKDTSSAWMRSKTPVSFYLAYRGWKVANVPLVLGENPAEALCQLDRHAVVGLTIDSEHLAAIRRARQQYLGLEDRSAYSDLTHIRKELEYCLNICRAYGWPLIEVTGKAVEETANQVINLVIAHSSGAKGNF